ncbi:hypothetical protein LMG27174_06661 [Paraburkholderia rhynchosiae]|uniref:Uncharacterized protein n=1 Tax=Paraburkholderia rhynchosiae TaxID=487049 RepID=A0A6J5CM35_9BURK|nr:hypothetical protein LMG27174_06661 [Paraburkholderia rhynchosiae]
MRSPSAAGPPRLVPLFAAPRQKAVSESLPMGRSASPVRSPRVCQLDEGWRCRAGGEWAGERRDAGAWCCAEAVRPIAVHAGYLYATQTRAASDCSEYSRTRSVSATPTRGGWFEVPCVEGKVQRSLFRWSRLPAMRLVTMFNPPGRPLCQHRCPVRTRFRCVERSLGACAAQQHATTAAPFRIHSFVRF